MIAPFVGRQAELIQVTTQLDHVRRDGSPAGALILGDPGSGKTRLLGEAVARAQFRRHMALGGFEPVRTVPFAAAADLLRLLAAVPGLGRPIEELVFGRAEHRSRDPLQIFEAAQRAVGHVGHVLISIDDLQWADELSIGLLHYLLRAAHGVKRPLAVIAAGRAGSAAATFRAGLEAALPAERITLLRLDALSADDGAALARGLDPRLSLAEARELWRRAAGSPFWIEALARGGADGDPNSAIADRLAAIGGDASAVLAALALAGRPVGQDLVGQVLDWEPSRVALGAAELVVRGLAVEHGGQLRAAHDLIREAAEPGIPAAVRRRVHARLAVNLERDAHGDLRVLSEALGHRLEADLPTTRLALRLARSPQRRLLGVDGLVRLASIAERMAGRSAERRRLDEALARLAAELGEPSVAMEHWMRVAEATDDPAACQRALVEAGSAAYGARLAESAHDFVGRARQLGTATPETTARMETVEADVALWLDHRTAEGSYAASRAVSAAERMVAAAGGAVRLSMGGRSAYLAALEAAMDAALQEEHQDDIVRYGEAIMSVAAGSDDETRLGALIRVAFAFRPLSLREASRRYREAWELSKRLTLPIAMIEAGQGLSRSLQEQGRFAEARAVAIETARLETRARASGPWGTGLPVVHEIDLSLGDPITAIRALHRDAELEPDPHFRLGIHQTIATWQARTASERAEAEVAAGLAAARADLAVVGCPRCAGELSIVSAELLARIGRLEDAERELNAWERRPRSAHPRADLWHARASAMIKAAAGDTVGALRILEPLAERQLAADSIDELLWTRTAARRHRPRPRRGGPDSNRGGCGACRRAIPAASRGSAPEAARGAGLAARLLGRWRARSPVRARGGGGAPRR